MSDKLTSELTSTQVSEVGDVAGFHKFVGRSDMLSPLTVLLSCFSINNTHVLCVVLLLNKQYVCAVLLSCCSIKNTHVLCTSISLLVQHVLNVRMKRSTRVKEQSKRQGNVSCLHAHDCLHLFDHCVGATCNPKPCVSQFYIVVLHLLWYMCCIYYCIRTASTASFIFVLHLFVH